MTLSLDSIYSLKTSKRRPLKSIQKCYVNSFSDWKLKIRERFNCISFSSQFKIPHRNITQVHHRDHSFEPEKRLEKYFSYFMTRFSRLPATELAFECFLLSFLCDFELTNALGILKWLIIIFPLERVREELLLIPRDIHAKSISNQHRRTSHSNSLHNFSAYTK